MRQRRNAREPEVDPFYDMLFNMPPRKVNDGAISVTVASRRA